MSPYQARPESPWFDEIARMHVWFSFNNMAVGMNVGIRMCASAIKELQY